MKIYFYDKKGSEPARWMHSDGKLYTSRLRLYVNISQYYEEKEFPDEYMCIKCNTTKPITHFHKQRGSKLGIKKWCKDCIRIRDYKKLNTWEGYIRKKIVASWSAHKKKK